MTVAIIGGTGLYQMPGLETESQVVETRFGDALVFVGKGNSQDLVFIPRHGPDHSTPPHRINYRANVKALEQLGVKRVLAIFAVGSLTLDVPPHSLIALDQILDFTHDRPNTFYDGGASGVGHADMTEPFCPALRDALLARAPDHGLNIRPRGTYVCANGPRFETAAEVRLFAQLGGDVVGMTGMPEAALARELGIHYMALAHSINWAAGLHEQVELVTMAMEIQAAMLQLGVESLRAATLGKCKCENATYFVYPPRES
ncbi:MAG: S-methyl-5'-thioinosine phosphorylase [Chloroflexi bacterium]|nr:S-methyl-5'-thioinosine phosphorylase [Chloroflexota bacterium]